MHYDVVIGPVECSTELLAFDSRWDHHEGVFYVLFRISRKITGVFIIVAAKHERERTQTYFST